MKKPLNFADTEISKIKGLHAIADKCGEYFDLLHKNPTSAEYEKLLFESCYFYGRKKAKLERWPEADLHMDIVDNMILGTQRGEGVIARLIKEAKKPEAPSNANSSHLVAKAFGRVHRDYLRAIGKMGRNQMQQMEPATWQNMLHSNVHGMPEDLEKILSLLESETPRNADIFRRIIAGEPYKEIGRALDMPVGSIKRLVHETRVKLQKQLQQSESPAR